eukprot:s1398_g24.t1
MWPPAATSTVDGVLQFYGIPSPVWEAFCGAVGDCTDLRVIASLPASMVAEATTVCRLVDDRRFTPVEAIQVGLVYRASHLLVHLAAGGNMGTWADPNPWTTPSSMRSSGAREPSSPGATGTPGAERKMKLSQVADQGDESEFPILPESQKAGFYSKYVSKVGCMPADSEDPTVEQLSAIIRKVRTLHQPPYCDFAVFVPFAKRHLRAQKYQSFVLQEDGSFMAKMVPGPSCFTHWQMSFRVLRTWQGGIHESHPGPSSPRDGSGRKCSAWLERGAAVGRRVEQSPSDRDFWHENVHTPAIAWTARGSRGKAMTPLEEWAESSMQGGKRALGLDSDEAEQDPKRRTKARREARKKRRRKGRAAEFSKKLQRWRGKGFWRYRRQRWLCKRGGGVLRLEQWQWPLWGFAAGRSLSIKNPPTPQMHTVPFPRSSFKGMSQEQEVSWSSWWASLVTCAPSSGSKDGGQTSGERSTEGQAVQGKDITKGVRTGTKRRRFAGDDPGGGEGAPKDKIMVNGKYLTFEEYLGKRKFLFLHHFSGKVDRLSTAVEEECKKLGIWVETASYERRTIQES